MLIQRRVIQEVKRSTLAVRQSIGRKLRYAVVVHKRGNKDKHVENLMTLTLQKRAQQAFTAFKLFTRLSATHARQPLQERCVWVRASENTNAPSLGSPVVDEERMRPVGDFHQLWSLL